MEDIKLKYITIEDFKSDVYTYYLEIFPEGEKKSIKQIQHAYENGYTRIIEILYNDKFVGFMTLNRVKENGYTILDYLAILPQYRNKQFGTKALKLLFKEEKNSRGIFVEIEKVGLGKDEKENLIRQKRKEFYERLGFKELNFDLFLFNVIFTPLLYSINEDKEDLIIKEIIGIYEEISGKERIRQNCKIMKPKDFIRKIWI